MTLPSPEHVLSKYEVGKVSDLKPLGNAGGFSGARLWQVNCDRGQLCLRKWPKVQPKRIREIHLILLEAAGQEIPVAAPLLNRSGHSLVTFSQTETWEVTPWVKGAADFNQHPSQERLRHSMEAVAKFHQLKSPSRPTISQGISFRVENLAQATFRLEQAKLALAQSLHPMADTGRSLLPRIEANLPTAQLALQPFANRELYQVHAIRDLHHDHVFFQGDLVSGIIDFGSMQIDSRCLDLARFVSSLRIRGKPPFETALKAYAEVSPLSQIEVDLMEPLALCNRVLGAMNWLDWLFVENRQFDDMQAVKNRLISLLDQFDC